MFASSKVLVVGSNMTDMITYCKRAPGPGETIVGDRYVTGFGVPAGRLSSKR